MPAPRNTANHENLLFHQTLNVFIDRLAGDSEGFCGKIRDISRVSRYIVQDKLANLLAPCAYFSHLNKCYLSMLCCSIVNLFGLLCQFPIVVVAISRNRSFITETGSGIAIEWPCIGIDLS